MNKKFPFAASLLLALAPMSVLLPGCGGGGAGNSSPSPTARPTGAATATATGTPTLTEGTPAPTATVAPAGSDSANLSISESGGSAFGPLPFTATSIQGSVERGATDPSNNTFFVDLNDAGGREIFFNGPSPSSFSVGQSIDLQNNFEFFAANGTQIIYERPSGTLTVIGVSGSQVTFQINIVLSLYNGDPFSIAPATDTLTINGTVAATLSPVAPAALKRKSS